MKKLNKVLLVKQERQREIDLKGRKHTPGYKIQKYILTRTQAHRNCANREGSLHPWLTD
jgi:hypothetical protein